MLGAIGRQKFTKALVLSSGVTVEEVDVSHAPSSSGSRYSPIRLVRLALHVVAGFWPQPVQWIGVTLGLVCTLAAAALGDLRRRLLGRRTATSPARSSPEQALFSSSASRDSCSR